MVKLASGQTKLWQWNTGQKLHTDFPSGTLFIFTTNGVDALDRTAYLQGGTVVCDIPNSLLRESGILDVYVHDVDGDQLTTVLQESYPVLPQPKPQDYVDSETEVQIWHALSKRIDKLEPLTRAPELIEHIDITDAEAGSKSVQRTGYDFREIWVMLHLPHSLDYAKTTRIIINGERIDKSDTDQFCYEFHMQDYSLTAEKEPERVPKDLSMNNDVHLCASHGVVYSDGHCRYLASEIGRGCPREAVDPVFVDERITGVTVEADGTGLEAGSYIEIRAIRS